VYGKPDDEKLKALQKDDVVTIIHDGKSYKVAFDMVTANELPEKAQIPTEGNNVQQAANIAPKTNGKLTSEEISEKATFMTGIYADIFHQLQASGLEPAQAQPAAATIFIQIGKYF
jgi:flagellin-specific chaperone FliS